MKASNVVDTNEVPESKGLGQWVFFAKESCGSKDFIPI
jgi:hypothetical protein